MDFLSDKLLVEQAVLLPLSMRTASPLNLPVGRVLTVAGLRQLVLKPAPGAMAKAQFIPVGAKLDRTSSARSSVHAAAARREAATRGVHHEVAGRVLLQIPMQLSSIAAT